MRQRKPVGIRECAAPCAAIIFGVHRFKRGGQRFLQGNVSLSPLGENPERDGKLVAELKRRASAAIPRRHGEVTNDSFESKATIDSSLWRVLSIRGAQQK